MSDIRSLGPRGEAIHKTATALKERNLVDDAQFKELTNGEVKPEDLKIADKALEAVKPTTANAFQMMSDIGEMQNDFNTLKRSELNGNVEELKKLVRERAGNAMHDFLNAIGSFDGPSVIRNIRQ